LSGPRYAGLTVPRGLLLGGFDTICNNLMKKH
jgi:hypothetical protein